MPDGKKRTVLLTGAVGGMGAATARQLAAEGFCVCGLDLRAPENPPEMVFLPTDLTDPAAVERAFLRLQEDGVELDAIVHMAGIYELNSLVEMDEADWARVLDVNLTAVWRINRVFLPLLRPGARIVITTSELAPLHPLPFTGIYAVSKAALDRYAEALRMELQLLRISVTVLRPGAVDTGLLDVSTRKLTAFCENTTHYACNARRFREIVDRVEARKIPPERVAKLASKALTAKHPRPVYSINRNPLLLLMNALPTRWQGAILRSILRPKPEKGRTT